MSSSPDSHVKRPHSQQDQVPATSIQPTATHASLDMQSSYFQSISNQLPPRESIISDQPTNQLPTIGQPSMHPSLITDQPTSEISIGRQTHNLSLITNQFPADTPVTGQLPGNAPVTTGHIPVQFPGNAPVTTGYIPTQHPGIVHWQPGSPLAATGHLSGYLPTVTNQLPANVQATTESLPANTPRTTKKLAPSGGTTTTRSLTHIPAPKARTSPSTALPPQPPRRRPMRWIGALVSCLLILLFTVIFVAPLGNNEHGQTIAQTVGNFFSPGSSSTFDP